MPLMDWSPPPDNAKFTCPWCSKKVVALLSSKTHDWLCHGCAQEGKLGEEPIEYDKPTPPAEPPLRDRRYLRFELDKPKQS